MTLVWAFFGENLSKFRKYVMLIFLKINYDLMFFNKILMSNKKAKYAILIDILSKPMYPKLPGIKLILSYLIKLFFFS